MSTKEIETLYAQSQNSASHSNDVQLYALVVTSLVALLVVSLCAIYFLDFQGNLRVVLFFVSGSLLSMLVRAFAFGPEDNLAYEQREVFYTSAGKLEDVIELEEINYTEKSEPWEIDASILIGKDNALALAKVRIDIEKEIRRVSYENNIPTKFPLSRLVRELTRSEIMEPEMSPLILDLIRACNDAVHGASINDETAERVVESSTYVLAYLRRINDRDRI